MDTEPARTTKTNVKYVNPLEYWWGLSHSPQTVSAASSSSSWPPGWKEEALMQPLPASSQLFCFGTESNPRKWLNKQEWPHLAQSGHSLHFVAFELGLWMSHFPIILGEWPTDTTGGIKGYFVTSEASQPSLILRPERVVQSMAAGCKRLFTSQQTREAERVAETFKGSPHNDRVQLHLLKAPQSPKITPPFGDTNSKHAPEGEAF